LIRASLITKQEIATNLCGCVGDPTDKVTGSSAH
jgi:hypothetical protein